MGTYGVVTEEQSSFKCPHSEFVLWGVTQNQWPYMKVSWGTPKSAILIGFSLIKHPFWGTPILGDPHMWPSHAGERDCDKAVVGKSDRQEQCDPCDSDTAADLETTEHPLILRMQKEAAYPATVGHGRSWTG